MSRHDDQYLIVINMTEYFKRPLFMYSLGDIRFSKPIALKKLAYIIVSMILWSLPIILIFGIKLNILYAAIVIGPPLLLGNMMSKPLFGGMSFIQWLKVCFRFVNEPKGWADLRGTDEVEETEYYASREIWISRRRELHHLADIAEERHEHEISQEATA